MKTKITPIQTDRKVDVIQTLTVLDKGRFMIAATREFGELMEAISDVQKKKGKLTITLDVAPSGWDEDGTVSQVDITPTITISKPKRDPKKTMFFVTEELGLQRDDPAQEKMFEK